MKISNRNQLAELLNELGLTGDGAFVGCAECSFEGYFLERWHGRAFWIDPWALLDTPGFSGHGEDTNHGQEQRYQRVLRSSKRYGDRCRVIRATSEEAVKRFADGTLDFVYLDAQHDYPSIQQDLRIWYPKLRRRAVFAGHDYLEGIHNGQQYGVKRAVTEFAAARGLTVNVTSENDWPSWFIFTP